MTLGLGVPPVVHAIGERLCAAGMQLEVKPVERGPAWQRYAAVVLGSALQDGAETTNFDGSVDWLALHRQVAMKTRTLGVARRPTCC